MAAAIDVVNLKKIYKNKRGISDVSFTVFEGEVFGLLGANGSGKTTTMKVITSLCKADSGEIKLFGENVNDYSEKAYANVGSLIEMPAFYGYLSAYRNLKIAADYYLDKSITDSNIDEALEEVGLLQFKKEKVGKFSLGMKQRLGLALAMIGKPKLYILDEPANGLDIEGIVEIRSIILNLAKNKNVSFVISSHMSNEIQKTCSKVGIIHEGRLKEISSMDSILQNNDSLESYYLKCIGSKMQTGFNGQIGGAE